MTKEFLIPLVGFLISGLGCALLNTVRMRFWKLAGVMLLYFGGSILLLNVCSFQMCVAFFVCGIGVVVLFWAGGGSLNKMNFSVNDAKEDLIFRFLLFVVFGILSYTIMEHIRLWIPVQRRVLFISVWCIMSGLISLSLDDDLFFRCVYLQSICLSLTIAYINMENSMLVFACFAVINLMMAFGCGVLISRQLPLSLDNGVTDE